MTKKKLLLALLALVCSALGSSFVFGSDAHAGCWGAYSVNDPGPGLPWAYGSFNDTYAAKYACNQSGQGPYGVMVLSEPVSGGVPSGGGTMRVNAYMDGDGPAEQYFYVTGGFYNRSNTSWTGYVWGWDVELRTQDGDGDWADQGIITGDNMPYSSSKLCYPSTGSCSYYTIGKYVYRGYKNNTTDRWFFGDDYTITINRDAFYDENRSGLHDLGNGLVYRTFGMHRCWAQSTSNSVAASTYHTSCGWADARLYGKKRIAQTNYSGSSSIETGGSGVSNNSSVTIHSPSQDFKFVHKVKRADDGDNQADNECYEVGTNVSGKGRSYSCSDFEKNGEQTIHDPTMSVGLEPGKSTVIYQDLRFQPSNRDDSLSGLPPQNCSISGYEASGRACISVSRPSATFTGTVTPTVTSQDGGTNYSIGSDNKAKVTSSDGKFKISFINRVNRNADTAGGTVGSNWSTRSTIAGAQQDANNGTASLTENGGSNVQTYTYTGTLRYGESITYCSYLTYVHTVTGTATNTASKCITVWRENAKCSFANSFTYGLNTAVNVGRLGVRNSNLSNNVTWTTPNSVAEVSIYARPTDQIKFYYNMCAGVLYPIKQRGLTTNVTFMATGSSTKSAEQNNKYLFRNSVPMVGSTFYNSRVWDSKYESSGFLSNINNIEASFESPDSGAGTNYRCGSVSSGWYQVAGKQECARQGVYNIGVLDVGSRIAQRLDWNDQTFNNGSFGSTPRAATANVVVPYNYVLKPYVTNESASNRVAYLGETIHMTPGVVVATRKNTAVSSDNNKNTYATITKPTSIAVDYYYTTSTGTMIINPVSIYSKTNVRLNNEADLNGTGNRGDAYIENGGSKLNGADAAAVATNFNIPVNDSQVSPGDRVCMRIRVWPADSHNNPTAASVGASDIAIQETGSGADSSRTTTSCLTVAKRPTISVEGSNAYSATTIKTSKFEKELGGTKFVFGSWSEYGVFARVDTSSFNMASGAALGYNKSGYKDGNGNYMKTPNVTRDNPAGSENVATTARSNICTYMVQTFANANCEAGTNKIGNVAAEQFSERIKERYSRSTVNVVSTSTKTMGGVGYQNLSGYSDGGVVEDDGAIVLRPNGNAYLGSNWRPNIADSVFTEKGITSRNNTIVYSMPSGTMVIDADINVQTGSLSGPGQVSGVVIVADKVLISSNVSYINATIVANEVNTCAFKADGSAMSFSELKWTGSASYPCAKPLQFDAPVSTKRIILNRTAGANNGVGSIVRAEIFNFNTAQYLWSFSQMARYNQAVTTFSRELPPRY